MCSYLFLSASYQEARDVSFPDIVDNNFDYLIETLPAKFLQCKVAIFPFVMNKSCEGNLYTFSHQF